jgi:hypothetical protein
VTIFLPDDHYSRRAVANTQVVVGPDVMELTLVERVPMRASTLSVFRANEVVVEDIRP